MRAEGIYSTSTLIHLHNNIYMSHRLYIGKLPSQTTSQDLETFFSQIGEVLSIEISHKVTFEENSGSAYVVMKNDADGVEAVRKLSNREIHGSRVFVMDVHPIDQKGHSYFSYTTRKKRRK